MSIFNELKRRNVFRVAAAYIIVAWLLLQLSDNLVPALRLPDWFHSGAAFLLILGFPIAINPRPYDATRITQEYLNRILWYISWKP